MVYKEFNVLLLLPKGKVVVKHKGYDLGNGLWVAHEVFWDHGDKWKVARSWAIFHHSGYVLIGGFRTRRLAKSLAERLNDLDWTKPASEYYGDHKLSAVVYTRFSEWQSETSER